jgi:hypothetical protein
VGEAVDLGAAPGLVEGRVALAPGDEVDRHDVGAERQQGVAHDDTSFGRCSGGLFRRSFVASSDDEVLWRSKPALAGRRGIVSASVETAPPSPPVGADGEHTSRRLE